MNILGIDIGGSSIKLSQYNLNGYSVLTSIPSKDSSPEEILSEFKRLFPSIRFDAVGIGFPGVLSKSGEILGSPNLPKWIGIHLKKVFESIFICPIFTTNDANLPLLSKFKKAPSENIALLTLGTGIGGAAYFSQKIIDGDFSGEFGHITVDSEDKLKCGCGRTGCIESYFSTIGIEKRYGDSPVNFFNQVKLNEPKALQHLNLICDKLAIAISNIHTIIAPTKIYFGGGISQSFILFEKILKTKLSQRLLYPGLKIPEILVLNEYDGSKGAIHLALQNYSGQPSES